MHGERDESSAPSVVAPGDVVDPQVSSHRFAHHELTAAIEARPAMPDRPVVARPVDPFTVMAGAEVTVFVGCPLWIDLVCGGQDRLLVSLPLQRPSDTWFGPPGDDGELCYASRTHCRMRLGDVPVRVERALTKVRIHNRSDADLLVERLKLPVESLSMFSDEQARLWTEEVALDWNDAADLASMRVFRTTPDEAGDAELVASGRRAPAESMSLRAFGSLFTGEAR